MTAPLILGTNSIKDEGYEVANSLRFNDGSSDYLSRTPTTESINKITFSCWVKRGTLGSTQRIFSHPSTEYLFHRFESNDTFRFTIVADGFETTIRTNRVFRDTSAWYHILVNWDTTQSVESNRIRLWINGVQETSFNLSTYPTLNSNSDMFNSSTAFEIGRYSVGNSEFFDGYMAELVVADGQSLLPLDFGIEDEDTGIWKPIDVSGLTFGTNGFYLDFENSGSLGADVSGNGNNFTVNNLTSIDQVTDSPTNNFCTKNPLSNTGMTYAEGNLEIGYSVASANARSTFGVSSGKWYWETKLTTVSADGVLVGICNEDVTQETSRGSLTGVYGVQDVTGNPYAYYRNNGSSGVSAGFPVPSQGDIVQCALDLDNSKFYMGINGTFYNLSGSTADPSAQTNPTFSSLISSTWFSFIEYRGGSATSEINYGNPTFSISSGNSDGNGYGNFEYSVPSGYYALNSKNLAEYG